VTDQTLLAERLICALAPLALMGGMPLVSLAFPDLSSDSTVWKKGIRHITVAQVREARAAIIAAGGLPKTVRTGGRFT
jgi:hypothetical protein